MSQTETIEKKPDINLKLKIYPFFGKSNNRKGNYVGDIKSTMIINELPYSYFDQVDHMMYNLFGYVRDRNDPTKYFKNKTYDLKYNNPPEVNGGKKRKTIKKMKKSKTNKKNKSNKSNKRNTYKK
jgi:hypothetical protein